MGQQRMNGRETTLLKKKKREREIKKEGLSREDNDEKRENKIKKEEKS